MSLKSLAIRVGSRLAEPLAQVNADGVALLDRQLVRAVTEWHERAAE